MNALKTLKFMSLAGALLASGSVAALAADVAPAGTIDIPGVKFDNFDISFVDSAAGRLYVADRSNAGIDVFDTHTDKFLYRAGGFIGAKAKSSDSGPDGVLFVPERNEIWAGDGDSTVKIFDTSAQPARLVATIPTGGKKRLDEMAYDPKDGIVIGANNADEPGFATLFSTKDHSIIGKIVIPEASDGIEQPEYIAETGLFYMSIPAIKDTGHGAVAVIDPKTAKVLKLLPIDACAPSGLNKGPGTSLIVGCAGKESTKTVIIDRETGKATSVPQVHGEDEVAYNPHVEQYYTASRDMKGGPVLGVIDAKTNKWIANVPTDKGAHSVAVDVKTDKIFVPLAAGKVCPNGCIAVYQAK